MGSSGLSHSVLLTLHKMPSCVSKRQKSSEDVEIVRKGKEMEDRPFRLERQKESKGGNYFKSSTPQGTGYESKTMWYVPPYTYLFLQTKPNKDEQTFLFYFLIAHFFKNFLFLCVSDIGVSHKEIKKKRFQKNLRSSLLIAQCPCTKELKRYKAILKT